MEEIIRALELKNQLDSLRPLEKEQEARIMQKFRLDWNYHSNNLEGNSLTYGETKALIMFGLTAHGKSFKDHTEVKGHNEAVLWVEEIVKGDRPLTENLIRELHEVLLVEPYEVDAITPDGKPTKKRIKVGDYKETPNHVKTKTGEIFYFATPEETPAKMGDLIAWYNEKIADNDLNPILLAAEFHYKFIRIHPFDDGNGRTARILMNFILMKFSYPPVIIKTEDKENYYAVLRLADADNLEAFIEYIAKNLNHSLEIMIAGANGEDIDDPDDIDKEIALLEKRLAGYGKEIHKEKSFATVNDIYLNTIIKIAQEIEFKLQKFKDYYLTPNFYIGVDQKSAPLSNYLNILETNNVAREIKISVSYQHIKKVGLETFSFNYQLYFEFNTLNYIVRDRNYNEVILTKNYENLSNEEIKFLADKVVKEHNLQLEAALGQNQ